MHERTAFVASPAANAWFAARRRPRGLTNTALTPRDASLVRVRSIHYAPALANAAGSAVTRACVDGAPTPMDAIMFRGTRVFVKRDDLLCIDGVVGSKARKFRALARPGALDGVRCIVSFGGSQSNAMRSLAVFAQSRALEFVYYTARLVPPHVRNQPVGNYYDAIQAGMDIRRVPDDLYDQNFKDNPLASAHEFIRNDLSHLSSDEILFIPQGGAWPGAEDGIKELAHELEVQLRDLRSRGDLSFPEKRSMIFLGAGTGTTAFYLARNIARRARVFAIPVAGSSDYLVHQMMLLDATSKAPGRAQLGACPAEFADFPDVIRPRVRSAFADVTPGKLAMWKELERAGEGRIHFDLIYGPPAWEEFWLALDERRLVLDRDVIFLHTGGLEGNVSMLNRFGFKGLLSEREIENLKL
jgi:1-aminocyclopropane-1-carboxylate deaminase